MNKLFSEKFYSDFGITKPKTREEKDFVNKQQIANLYKVPKKDKGVNMPHFQDMKPGATVQIDLLFLPDDKGYKYLLVAIDTASRLTDAEPLDSKDSDAVLDALKDIFDRGIVKKPSYSLEVDHGSEFKGAVKKYCQKEGIYLRVAKVGRHRQQALVERRNQTIGEAIHKGLTYEQLKSGKLETGWVKYLKPILKSLNEYVEEQPKQKIPDEPVCEGDSCKMLEIGTKVRVQLDEPKESTGQKLSGKFRKSDIRWDPKIREIKQVLIKPGSPPMYLLDGKEAGDKKVDFSAAYTKNQLQVVPKDEKLPDIEVKQPPKKKASKEEIKIVEKVKKLGAVADDTVIQTSKRRGVLKPPSRYLDQ